LRAFGCIPALKGVTHLRHHCFRAAIHIRRSEAQDAKAGDNQSILPTVVINQPIAVVATVIFDRQALIPIEQVWTT
jgi:hypothetical protein